MEEEEWLCPICRDILYKPCVNTTCGHAFCFWCFHHCMNGFRKSSCPLCRSPYANFPKVCSQLHFFLEHQFPDLYKNRYLENAEYEEKRGVRSPELPQLTGLGTSSATASKPSMPGPTETQNQQLQGSNNDCIRMEACRHGAVSLNNVEAPSEVRAVSNQQGQSTVTTSAESGSAKTSGSKAQASSQWLPEEEAGLTIQAFACSHPACEGLLAVEPAVLSCGHLVCYRTCRPEGPAAVNEGTGMPGGVSCTCPKCRLPVLPGAGRCSKLDLVIGLLYPEELKARKEQQSQKLVASVASSSQVNQKVSPDHLGNDDMGMNGHQLDLEVTGGGREETGAASSSDHISATTRDAAESVADSSSRTRSGAPRMLSKVPGLEQKLATCPNRHSAWQLAWSELALHADVAYTWFAVGCDGCGSFPIQGRRYRCEDCPETIGFDLCGACYDLGWGGGRGRFNQQHTAQHRLTKIEPEFLYKRVRQRQEAGNASSSAATSATASAAAETLGAAQNTSMALQEHNTHGNGDSGAERSRNGARAVVQGTNVGGDVGNNSTSAHTPPNPEVTESAQAEIGVAGGALEGRGQGRDSSVSTLDGGGGRQSMEDRMVSYLEQQQQVILAVVNVLESLHPELSVEEAMRLAWMEWGSASITDGSAEEEDDVDEDVDEDQQQSEEEVMEWEGDVLEGGEGSVSEGLDADRGSLMESVEVTLAGVLEGLEDLEDDIVPVHAEHAEVVVMGTTSVLLDPALSVQQGQPEGEAGSAPMRSHGRLPRQHQHGRGPQETPPVMQNLMAAVQEAAEDSNEDGRRDRGHTGCFVQ